MTTDIQNWTESDLYSATTAQLTRWAQIIGGKPWGADKGKPRIYMPSRKSVRVFFEFGDYPTGDANDLLGGAALRVHLDDCGQHANWYASQKQQIAQRMYTPSLALSAAHAGDESLATAIIERGDVSAAELDEAGAHLINGRVSEAKQALGM